MKIYLLDINKNMTTEWYDVFKYKKTDWNIDIIHGDLKTFLDTYNVECIVSPANSFGLMDGGYDYAITEYFGDILQKNVQKYILDKYYGEQTICTSFIIDIPNTDKRLIHTPSMLVPMDMRNSDVVYQCTRATLICALENNINSIVIPAFGGGCGKIEPRIIAKQMQLAFDTIFNRTNEINWQFAIERCNKISSTVR